MARVLALVEGPTERNFCQRILAPHLAHIGVYINPRVIGKPGHKGGVGEWQRAKREIAALVRQEPTSVVTTMFDLYGLPDSWPGRQEAKIKGLKHDAAAEHIEACLKEAVVAEFAATGLTPRFIPYLSLHEYEALLFADPAQLAEVVQASVASFQAIVAECGECEKINDNPNTAPSKRIGLIARGYDKTVDGIAAAERIGVATMRAKCPHFAQWLDQLECLCG